MKNWGYKLYIQYILPITKRPFVYISTLFGIVGGYYTLCEIEQNVFKTDFLIGCFRKHIARFIIGFILITICILKEKSEKSSYIGSKDTIVSLKLANLLSIKKSAIVIPTNTTFDTIINDEFISVKSIQGQFQKKFYGNDYSELNNSIKSYLDQFHTNSFSVLQDRTKTNTKRYDIGTVAKVTQRGQHFYFLAVADVSPTGKPENVTMQNMTKALVGLWDFLSQEGHNEPITIPVIGTGRGGLRDGTLEDVVHESIFSFITKSQDEFVSRKMTVCIYPQSLSDANVTWEDLCDYLQWQCKFNNENIRKAQNSSVHGKGIT